MEEKGREGLISAASGRSENAFRHRGRRVTSAYREQVERRCGSFSRHRGQPRPARRGQQREVEVRFGALGVARTMSRVESSRVEASRHTETSKHARENRPFPSYRSEINFITRCKSRLAIIIGTS